MYIPSHFVVTDLETLHSFIEQNSFGILVSQQEGAPFATHLPFLLDRSAGQLGTLFGHVARANPQWKQLSEQRVLVVFHGPHAYISPTWYEAEHVVPTWNYMAVHAYGRVKLIEDVDALHHQIASLVNRYERSLPAPWSLGERSTFSDRLLDQIVGFQIELESLEGKWKLNQNHPMDRQKKVIAALLGQGDEDSRGIAEAMWENLAEAALSDEELVAAFEEVRVTHRQWNHRAHVRVGYVYVSTMGLEGATNAMRTGLQKLNAKHGSPNTLRRGYHETITVAFLRLLRAILGSGATAIQNSSSLCEAFPAILDKNVLLRFYSQDRLWSWEAKEAFIEPDLQPLAASGLG